VQATAVPNTPSAVNTAVPESSSQANLQITGIGLVPSPPQCLQSFTVQLNIRNTGTAATTSEATVFVSDTHIASGSQGTQGSGTVPILAPAQDWVVNISLTVSTFLAE